MYSKKKKKILKFNIFTCPLFNYLIWKQSFCFVGPMKTNIYLKINNTKNICSRQQALISYK